jgi:tetratricopeptide (TPR) repeat protein
MAKGFIGSIQTYMRNLGHHARRLVSREETTHDAMDYIARDSVKLKRALVGTSKHKHNESAKAYLKKGRDAYNMGRYDDAEDEFRNAIIADRRYARAYLYLGNTLYKLGRGKEAVHYWEMATEAEPKSDAARNAEEKLSMASAKQGQVKDWIDEHMRR